MMRIAYVTADPGVPVFGRKGCSIHVREVLRAMARRGAKIDLFATNCSRPAQTVEPDLQKAIGKELNGASGMDEFFESAGIRLQPLPRAPKGELSFREQQCLAANDSLRSALVEVGPFDLVYERYSLWSFAGMEYASMTGIPGLLEINAPLIEEQAQHRGLIDHEGARAVAEKVFRAAASLIAVSDEVAEYLETFSATRGKVSVVPNGVNGELYPAGLKASFPATPGIFTVGFVGSMKPWHGLSNLIEAFALFHKRNHQSRLLLVGDGPGREQLAAEASARGLDTAVHFTGAVGPAEVPGFLASMDVAVAPYPKLANFYFSPLKVYEYMAAGLAVVASRVGQIEQLIQDGVTGLLVSPGDISGVAEKLDQLRADPELRLRLGQAARAKVLQNHTWDGAVRRILSLARIGESKHLIQQHKWVE